MVKYSTLKKIKKSTGLQTYISNCSQTNHATRNPPKRWCEAGITKGFKKFKELKKILVTISYNPAI